MREAPRMTRQHFEFIADVIANATWYADSNSEHGIKPHERLRLAQVFAKALKATNPAFDREKFVHRATPERAR